MIASKVAATYSTEYIAIWTFLGGDLDNWKESTVLGFTLQQED